MKCYWQGSVLIVFIECDQPRSPSEQRRWTLRCTLQSPFLLSIPSCFKLDKEKVCLSVHLLCSLADLGQSYSMNTISMDPCQ